MQPHYTILARRWLATFSTWLAIAVTALYLGFQVMPHLGFHGSLSMGFRAVTADHVMASLSNICHFHLSIHLNY